jgi:hypothetical protein
VESLEGFVERLVSMEIEKGDIYFACWWGKGRPKPKTYQQTYSDY